MPDNPYKVGDKLWWVNRDFQPVSVTVKKVTELGCLASAEGRGQLSLYIRYRNLFWDEITAWADANVQLATQILEKRKELDALFELRATLRKHLHQMPED